MPTDGELWVPPLSPKDQEKLDAFLKKNKTKTNNKWKWGFSDKTGWDYLQLLVQLLTALILPTVLFIATQQFSEQQGQTSSQVTQDQQQETALQTYLDRMSDLLLNNKLREVRPKNEGYGGNEVRNVARSRTLTILPQLNGVRKRELVRFLYETGLIDRRNTVLSLNAADLHEANLSSAYLSYADLWYANLRGANLSNVNLSSADISYADLSKANLNGTYFGSADPLVADHFVTDLGGADLSGADLRGAYLNFANLRGANLSNVNLKGTHVTQEQLEQTKSLQGAIMPDGSIHP
jgi:uncharacterized protein YjbI with pentapeptide repeats